MTDIFDRKPTEEELREKFSAALAEISFTPAELMGLMIDRGDYRDSASIIRSINRMVSGETRVSGEMMVLVNGLVRQHRRLKQQYPDLVWNLNEHGTYSAQVGDWHVYIVPKSKGRWLLYCRDGVSDYSPPFGRWLSSLEEAKNKALMSVDEGITQMAENIFYNNMSEKYI